MLKLFKNLFHTTKSNIEIPNNSTALLPHQNAEGWIKPYSAATLLNTELRQKYLGLLWQQVSMTKEMFNSLYQKPIEHYAEMVQLLPASENHHHAHLGGMLDHGLEVLTFATKLRQNYVLPQNAAPEEQARQRDAWTAAVIYAALVHDIGKVIVDVEIHLQDGQSWFAWNGIPTQPYKFKYIRDRDYELHPVLGGFLANYLIPKEAFDWLAQYPVVFSTLMYVFTGHYDKGGLLSEIVQKADQYSTTLALGGDINKVIQRPVQSLSKQLLLALRHLLRHKLKINTPQGPADGWFTEDGLWLMSKTIADQIRAYLLEQGISVPSDNRKLFDELQTHGIIENSPENKAVWHCKVTKLDANWKPNNVFSLLRVKPEIAWENIEERPEYFTGTIIIYTDDKSDTEVTPQNTTKQQKTEAVKHDAIKSDAEQNEALAVSGTMTENAITEAVDIPADLENNSTNYLLDLLGTSAQDNKNIADTAPDISEPIEIENKPEIFVKRQRVLADNETTDIPQANDKKPNVANQAGESFVNWLKSGILKERFPISKSTAKLHLVKDSSGHINLFLVSPSIFELYLQEMGKVYDQEAITELQYDFQDLGLHKKCIITDKNKQDSVNFWCCSVIGPRKNSRLVGYLIPNTEVFFGKKVLLPNQRLTLIEG
ncbi:MobH family relaxase [Exercitatus varius]|uniref:MobH family relaxase n=1 Tax=Exercitatus varius TaxID=67857 RepID=UPI00294B3ACD|nr:MobH family relaxase [Exercitatus varius]MDG2961684.1 MobH family relaxase [Exercitatus varius]